MGCHVRLFPRRGMTDGLAELRALAGVDSERGDVRREAFVECPMAHPTLMLRREVLRARATTTAPGRRTTTWCCVCWRQGSELGVVPERLLHWRDGAGRLSRSSDALRASPAFVECKAEYLARGFLRDVERYVLWGYGDTGKALADALARRGKHPSAIVELHPGRLGQLIRGVRVIPPERCPRCHAAAVVSVAGHHATQRDSRRRCAQMGFTELARLRLRCA